MIAAFEKLWGRRTSNWVVPKRVNAPVHAPEPPVLDEGEAHDWPQVLRLTFVSRRLHARDEIGNGNRVRCMSHHGFDVVGQGDGSTVGYWVAVARAVICGLELAQPGAVAAAHQFRDLL